jgi:hypothetical protein
MMIIKHLRSLAVIALLFGLLLTSTCSQAAENGFRLIYIGSLSGYVKLCG